MPRTPDRVLQGYAEWIESVKERIRHSCIRTVLQANAEQLLLYWDIGHEIVEKQSREGWGTKVVERMSTDLRSAFPGMPGWSRSNLMYMRQFAEAWCRKEIVQQPVGQLPWGHHLKLLERFDSHGDRQVKAKVDGKTIGILLCRSRNDIVAEYALADLQRPIGVSTYHLGLPSPEQLQEQLQKILTTKSKVR